MDNKVYIVSPSDLVPLDVAIAMSELNDEFVIASTFDTDSEFSMTSEKYKYYISNDQLDLDYKNNALLYVITNSITQNSYGIAIDEFYNSNIIPLSIKAFNTISPSLYEDSLIVWVDSKWDNMMKRIDKELLNIDIKYFMDITSHHKDQLLYFSSIEDKESIAKIVNDYIEGDEEQRREIVSENS